MRARKQIQYVFQNPYASLNPRRTVGQTIARQLALFGAGGGRSRREAAIVDLLRQLRSDTGLSLLFITHNLALIRTIADRVVVMTDGRIVESGPTIHVGHAAGDGGPDPRARRPALIAGVDVRLFDPAPEAKRTRRGDRPSRTGAAAERRSGRRRWRRRR